MAPVLFKWIPWLNIQADFGLKLKGKPLFGSHKTIRGLLSGIITAILIATLQSLIFPLPSIISLFNYQKQNPLLLGFLLGFGALFGDLVKSSIKRQLNIKPGKSWIPFDQIDWIIGANIFVAIYVKLPLLIILTSIILFGFLHPLINLLGYFLKIKKNKF